MTFRLTLIWGALCCLITALHAQEVLIENLTTDELSICQEGEWVYGLENTTINLYNDIEVTLLLPEGVEYVPGSSVGLDELNLSNLDQPVFSLDLMPQAQVRWSFQVTTDCALYNDVQQGALFTNEIQLSHSDLNIQYEDPVPYAIRTALLVIQPAGSNRYVSGVSSNRTLRITNTRLGRIDRMVLTHDHEPLDIRTSQGTILNQSSTQLEIELDGDDFAQIGNGDEFFDPNETWEYLETLNHAVCENEILQSQYRVQWGCEGSMCQADTLTSDLIFEVTNQVSRLRVTGHPYFPECPCAPAQQCIRIENIGGAATDSTRFWFRYGDSLNMREGIDMNSILVNQGSLMPDSIKHRHQKFLSCDPNGDYTHESHVFLPSIDPGATVEICFDLINCLDTINLINNLAILDWLFGYEHKTLCNPNHSFKDNGIVVLAQREILETDFSWRDSIGTFRRDTQITADWTVEGERLQEGGRLSFSLCYPCMYEAQPNFQLSNGRQPAEIDTIIKKSETEILYHYDLPFDEDAVSASASVRFSCESPCLDSIGSGLIGQYNSSCPNSLGFADNILSSLSLNTFFTPCTSPPFCTYKFTECRAAAIQCKIGKLSTDIPAYMNLSGSAQRLNNGFEDKDDDRRRDNLMIKTDNEDTLRLTYGDTILLVYEGSINIDQPGTYDSLAFMVSSRSLTRAGFQFELIDGEFTHISGNTGEEFRCTVSDGRFIQEGTPPVACCGYTVTGAGLPQNGVFEITPEKLEATGCPFPDFEMRAGDSVSMVLRLRSIEHTTEVFGSDLVQRLEVYDRSNPSPRFVCEVERHPYLHSSMILDFETQGAFEYDACNSNPVNGGFALESLGLSENFFPREFRQQIQIESAVLRVSDFLKVDSVLVHLVYTNGVNDTLLREWVPTTETNDSYVIDSSFINGLFWDEGAKLFIEPYVEVISCENVRQNPSLSLQISIKAVDDFRFAVRPNILNAVGSYSGIVSETVDVEKTRVQLDDAGPVIFAYDSVFCARFLMTTSDTLEGLFIRSSSKNDPGRHHLIRSNLPGLTFSKVTNSLSTGRIPDAGQYELEVCYSNSSCEDDSLQVDFFWTCDGDLEGERCFQDSFFYEVRKVEAEIELDVVSKSERINLCDTTDWITLEGYSADLGTVYDLKMIVERFDGMEILPGSIEYRYPISGNWQPAPLNEDFSGLSLEWNLISLLNGRDGLPGVPREPDNGFQVRFKTVTDCDFTSGSFFTFNLMGMDPCGRPTNQINKSSQPIFIEGAPRVKTQIMNAQLQTEDCSDEALVRVVIQHQESTAGDDVIDISFEHEGELMLADLIPIRNMNDQSWQVDTSGSGYRYRLLQNQGVSAGDSTVFTFKILGLDQRRCIGVPINISSKFPINQFCPYRGEPCEASVVHSQIDLDIPAPGFTFTLNDYRFDLMIDSCLYVFGQLEWSDHPLDEIRALWHVFTDENGNGQVDTNDVLLNEGVWMESDLVQDSICLSSAFTPGDCRFNLVVSGNCMCTPDTIAIIIDQVVNFEFRDTLCSGDSLLLGEMMANIDSTIWEGPVDCDTCMQNLFLAPDSVGQETTFAFKRNVFSQIECDRVDNYHIVVRPSNSGSKQLYQICQGEEILLESENVVQWQGPDIMDEGTAILVAPDSTSTYLAYDALEACGRVDTYCVEVFRSFDWLTVTGDTVIQQGDSVWIRAFNNGPGTIWLAPDSLNCDTCSRLLISPDTTTSYTASIVDSTGCSIDTVIVVTVLPPSCDERNIYVPNAFSPNGDGFNDTWRVIGNFIDEVRIQVYNRWGERMYETTDPQAVWDGRYQGMQLEPDVFAFYVQVRCFGGETYTIQGNLTLVR